jgi:TPR repeat protein
VRTIAIRRETSTVPRWPTTILSALACATCVFVLTLLAWTEVACATFEVGLRAYQRGDFESAMKEFRDAAAAGDTRSMTLLGYMYSEGEGVEVDYGEALRLWQRASSLNDAAAAYNIGIAYRDARGVAQNYATAVEWFGTAAGRGDSNAMNDLARAYQRGRGIAKDMSAAIRLYEQAAALGNERAQYNLGVAYQEGAGLPIDLISAAKWYRASAIQGAAPAQYNLAVLYDEGDGVVQDYVTARKWYEAAARQGHADAALNIGVLTFNGRGVPRNEVVAYAWLLAATGAGSAIAREKEPILGSRLTELQRTEGQRLSKAIAAGRFEVLQQAGTSAEVSTPIAMGNTRTGLVPSVYGTAFGPYHSDAPSIVVPASTKVVNEVSSWDGRIWLFSSTNDPIKSLGELRDGEIAVWGLELFDYATRLSAHLPAVASPNELRIISVDNPVFGGMARPPRLFITWSGNAAKLRGATRVELKGEGADVPDVDTLMLAQRRLADLGHRIVAIDGKMGPQTRNAIIEFQREHGLTDSGELDSETRRTLAIR